MGDEHLQIEADILARWEAKEYGDAVAILLRQYGQEIARFLKMRVREQPASGEVFSQFSEDLLRGFPAFQWRCSARVWAYKLAGNAANRYLKAARRQKLRHVPISQAEHVLQQDRRERTDTQVFRRTEVKTRIAQLRERLTSQEQLLLMLRVNRNLDWKEIAQIFETGDSPMNEEDITRESARLRQRFRLVTKKLRKMAQEEGLLET